MIVNVKRLGLIALLLLGLNSCVSQSHMFDSQMEFSKKNKQSPTKEVWSNVHYVAIGVNCTSTCLNEKTCLFVNKVADELNDFDLGSIFSQELQKHLTRDGRFEVLNYDPDDKRIDIYISVGLQVGLYGSKPMIDLLADWYLMKPESAVAIALQDQNSKLNDNVYSLYLNEATKRIKFGNPTYYREMCMMTTETQAQLMRTAQMLQESMGGVDRVKSKQNTKEVWLQNNGQKLQVELKRLALSLARSLADSMLLYAKNGPLDGGEMK